MNLNRTNRATGYSSKEIADSIASGLQKDEQEWTYVVVKPEGSELYFINIIDEDGNLVARWSS